MKIAPQVQKLVASKMLDAPTTAELRALIAVARAAKVKSRGDITRAIEHHNTGTKRYCRLCRALDRLERVSGWGR